jgi:prepilin-type N-terminal cleavage/methylation domain-containing protein
LRQLEISALSVKTSLPRNGFTLLEIMVALAIFSLAALAMVRLQGYSVRSLYHLACSRKPLMKARLRRLIRQRLLHP